MRVTVDGRSVMVAPGATVLDAIRSAGADVPTLCFDERLSPHGGCRVCLVALDGVPAAACSAPAHDGAVVDTRDPAARAAARGTLELIVAELPPRALDAPAERSELVRVCRQFGIGAADCGEGGRRGRDDSHPYVKLDRDLCIACARCVRMCDEVQGTFALTLAGRGADTVVAPAAADWLSSACVACGACVDSCPTGALSEPGLRDPRATEPAVTTTCGYCAVGCTLDVHARDGTIAAITPNRHGPANRGHACVNGRFAHGFARVRDRLLTPQLRQDGELVPVAWDEALAFAAARLRAIRDDDGPDAIAAIASARATTEELYLLQKLMRVAIGTNNVDNVGRLCHAPSSAGLATSLGVGAATNALDDLDRAECLLLAGANPTEAHPVLGARIKQRVIAGAGLVVIDPRRSELARYADVHLRPRPGTDVALFHALAHVLLAEDLADLHFVHTRAEHLSALREHVAAFAPEQVERITGVPAADVRRAARLYAQARPAALLWGLGVTQHVHGTDAVRALVNLAILTANVGTRDGGGAIPLRGQNNVQGAVDAGALPELLPGNQRSGDPDAAARFAAAWGAPIRPERGLRIPEMLDAALDGRLRALYVLGGDLTTTLPGSERVAAALGACELVICQDLFLTPTAQHADLVLPGASFLEKDGTFVNLERRVQRVRPALPPPGRARTDFDIVGAIASALGSPLGCPTPAAAFDELAALAPAFAGLSHRRLDREGPLHWPCRSSREQGEPVLHLERFATPNGRAQLATPEYAPPPARPDPQHPFLLITGRRLEHFGGGGMTRRTPNIHLRGHERIDLHPDDAARLGIAEGAWVRVTSRRGQAHLTAHLSDRVRPGEAFAAFHFPLLPVNRLTGDDGDAATGCPAYKATAVALSAGRS